MDMFKILNLYQLHCEIQRRYFFATAVTYLFLFFTQNLKLKLLINHGLEKIMEFRFQYIYRLFLLLPFGFCHVNKLAQVA